MESGAERAGQNQGAGFAAETVSADLIGLFLSTRSTRQICRINLIGPGMDNNTGGKKAMKIGFVFLTSLLCLTATIAQGYPVVQDESRCRELLISHLRANFDDIHEYPCDSIRSLRKPVRNALRIRLWAENGISFFSLFFCFHFRIPHPC